MPPKKRVSREPRITAVDFGFGEGDRIKSWVRRDRPERVICGVESPRIRKDRQITIEGADIKYSGMVKWLKDQRNASIKIVNGDFVLTNTFRGSLSSRLRKFKKLFKLLKEKLVWNGRVYFTVFRSDTPFFLALMGKCGFKLVSKRTVSIKGLKTLCIKAHYVGSVRDPPTRIVFRSGNPIKEQMDLLRELKRKGPEAFGKAAKENARRLFERGEALTEAESAARHQIEGIQRAFELLGVKPPEVEFVNRTGIEELERLRGLYRVLPEAIVGALEMMPPDNPFVAQMKEAFARQIREIEKEQRNKPK